MTYICFILGYTPSRPSGSSYPSRPSGSSHSAFREADGGTCTYNCKSDGGCNVSFKANGLYNGNSKGSCFPLNFGGDCIGTPRFCTDCIDKCQGQGVGSFNEEV